MTKTSSSAPSASRPLACVILAAGMGTRMHSNLPKVMHHIAGLPMVRHVLSACTAVNPERIIVVVAPNMPTVEIAVSPHPCVVQKRRWALAMP